MKIDIIVKSKFSFYGEDFESLPRWADLYSSISHLINTQELPSILVIRLLCPYIIIVMSALIML